jgi:hypothetical protein
MTGCQQPAVHRALPSNAMVLPLSGMCVGTPARFMN